MSRDTAVAKLVAVFQQWGYDGATLSRLSAASGLGRASLYHHFPDGKASMAAAVLAYVSAWWAANIFEPLGDRTSAPRERLERFSARLLEFYQGGQSNCLLNTMTLGSARDLFGKQVARSLRQLIATLAEVAIEAGIEAPIARQRAEEAVIQIQGALVLARGLDSTTAFERTLAALPERLLAPAES